MPTPLLIIDGYASAMENLSHGGMGITAALVLISIFLPIIGGFALMAGGDRSESFARNFALVLFAVPAFVALWVWAVFNAQEPAQFLSFGDYSVGLDSFGIRLRLGMNGISMPLYALAGIVGLAAGIYACSGKAENIRQYLSLLLIMQGGLMGVFATTDIFFFYFFHEVALIPTFVTIGIWGGRARRTAAIEMAVYLTIGAMLSLLGLIMLYQKLGLASFDMIAMREYFAAHSDDIGAALQENIFGILMIGFGILVSLWPFHSWAPRAYASAPTSVAMLHAGVLKKFGLYGLIQIAAPLLPEGAGHWSGLLVILALGNLLVIGLVTIAQRDLKMMLGYSSVMHMGYAFLGIACLSHSGVGGAVLMMFAHGLSVALLFMLSTCIYHRSETFDMDEMGGLGAKAPVLSAMFVAATLASVGLPGFANFWGELAIFVSLWALSPAVAALAILGIIISAIYGLRAAANIFFGPETQAMQEATRGNTIEDMRAGEKLSAAVLVAALFIVGIWPKLISVHVDHALATTLELKDNTLVGLEELTAAPDATPPGAEALELAELEVHP